MSKRYPRLLAFPAIAVTMIVTGCGDSTTSHVQSTRGSSANCDSPSPTTNTKAPAVAVLAPVGSGSSIDEAAFDKNFRLVLEGAQTMQARFVMNGIAQGPGGPNLLVNTSMTPEGSNSLFRNKNLECKNHLVATKLQELKSGTRPATLDLISALSALKDNFKTIPNEPVNIVVMGSALTRTQIGNGTFVDLRDVNALRNSAVTINKLADAGLNFRCDGWQVTMIGGSHNSDGSPGTPTTDTGLKQFWRTYFQHCGGTLVAYSDQIAEFRVTGDAIDTADTSKLPVTIKTSGKTVTVTLNSNVLFDTGSAMLKPEVDHDLQRLVPILTRAKGAITIDGHTDSTGSDSVNVPLSKARASSVASWIVDHTGVPNDRLRTRGLGSSEPTASNDTPDGRAKNRRVVITIQT